tara:strand:+ start:4312 stop:4830 length:519 start_codon:yes stop_codon:yes gene_type:complete
MLRVLIAAFVLFIGTEASAKKVTAEIVLMSNDTVAGTISGYRNGLISPYSKVRADRRYELSEIKSITILKGIANFKVIHTSVYEDSTYLFIRELKNQKWKGLISFRQCTCNERYQVTEAIFIENQQKLQPILKHLFRDKILKKRGDYFGLTPEQKELMSSVSFKFSSIMEVL